MPFKKSLSLALIVSLVGTVSFAEVTPVTATASTPEMSLLSSVSMLSGENLPAAELREKANAELQQYDATAPKQGRAERIAQALVSLKIETPEQAQAFDARIQSAAGRLGSAQFASGADAQKALQAEVQNLIAGSQGAEFSADCAEDFLTAAMFAAALGGAVYGFQSSHSDVVKGLLAFMAPGLLFVTIYGVVESAGSLECSEG